MTTPPPGWYTDTNDPRVLRWWDGVAWTPHVAPAQQQPAAPAPPHPVTPPPLHPVAPAPQQPVAPPQVQTGPPKRRGGLWWGLGLGLGAVVVIVGGLAVWLVLSFVRGFDLGDGLSLVDRPDTDLARASLESGYVGPWAVGDVYADGTSCEQLCSFLYVEFVVPEQAEPYSGAEVAAAFDAVRDAELAAGWQSSTYVCFRDEADVAAGSVDGQRLAELLTPGLLESGEADTDPDGSVDFAFGGCILDRVVGS